MKAHLKRLFRALPPWAQRLGHSVYAQVFLRIKGVRDAGLKRQLFGARAPFVPPLHIMEDGPQDFRAFHESGMDAFELLTKRCGLKPTDRILDIGSGIGRKTWPLLGYLAGSYEGLDPIARQVTWCQRNITSHYPNFWFQPIDVWSKLYNPGGKTAPAEYVFPFGAEEFDFVMLGSVFTHMFMGDMRHYVSEIQRVLKPGGQGMITYLLLNEESERLIAAGRSTQQLVHSLEEGAKADNPHRFETSIGHLESAVIAMYQEVGIAATVIEYGSWSGRAGATQYQDILHIIRH